MATMLYGVRWGTKGLAAPESLPVIKNWSLIECVRALRQSKSYACTYRFPAVLGAVRH